MHSTSAGDVTINHNGDWSGDAIVTVGHREIEIPCSQLISGSIELPADPIMAAALYRAVAMAVTAHAIGRLHALADDL